MLSSLLNFFSSEALTHNDLHKMTFRNKFSKFLPYRAYDGDEKTYFNFDDTVGWLWECTPLIFAGTKTFEGLQGLFTAGLPEGSVVQFMLYADPFIKPTLEHHASLKTREGDLIQEATKRTLEFYQKGTKGFDKMAGIPARDFKLVVALKIPFDKSLTRNTVFGYRDNIKEILKGVGLNPVDMKPGNLIRFLGRILNDEVPDHMDYDPNIEINQQIIKSETPIVSEWKKMKIGSRHLRCQTVKQMANTIEDLAFNVLTGDYGGPSGDGNQVNTPFFITVNVIFQDMSTQLHSKCNFVLQQQAVGSLAPSLKRKQEEYLWATGEIEKGVKFVRIQPIVWSIAETETQSREVSSRIKRLWDSKGFVTQEDRGILKILFLAALPFGLYTQDKAVDFIDRDFLCQPEVAARCLPIQSDLCGAGEPHMLFLGRKGQLVTFDLFSEDSNNYNGLISAESGSGKSFVTNSIAYQHYASGAKIRIIDVGDSYLKLCNMVGGKFISFGKKSNICINPFTNIKDIDDDIASIQAIVTQMIFSASGRTPKEEESTIIKNAINTVYELYGNKGDIDKLHDMFINPDKHMTIFSELDLACEDGKDCMGDLRKISMMMGLNIRSFTSKGEYGKWFNGPANLDIDNDDFVVLELEELKAQPELFNVVTLQVVNSVTSGLYLSDKTKKQLIIFDEAWQFFGESSMLAQVIEEGYRKARKYLGSFICITQRLMDTKDFGRVGAVIRGNSKHKMTLQAEDVQEAAHEKVIKYDPFTIGILESVKSMKPRYSEIFLDSSMGTGVMRLLVDPFTYFLYTSDPKDKKKIDSYVNQGFSYVEAINELIKPAESS